MDSAVPPPAGTITFLFTDIEGSTRLWGLTGWSLADRVHAWHAAAWADGRAMSLGAAIAYALEDGDPG